MAALLLRQPRAGPIGESGGLIPGEPGAGNAALEPQATPYVSRGASLSARSHPAAVRVDPFRVGMPVGMSSNSRTAALPPCADTTGPLRCLTSHTTAPVGSADQRYAALPPRTSTGIPFYGGGEPLEIGVRGERPSVGASRRPVV